MLAYSSSSRGSGIHPPHTETDVADLFFNVYMHIYNCDGSFIVAAWIPEDRSNGFSTAFFHFDMNDTNSLFCTFCMFSFVNT